MKKDPLKKAKEFLTNIMKINECKARIQMVMQQYPKDSEDEDLLKPDLEILIENMTTIIACEKEYNRVCKEDEECLETLKYLLKSKP